MKTLWLLTAGVAVLLSGCVRVVSETWQEVPDKVVDYAYVKPDADLSVYTRLYAEPFEVYFPTETGTPDPDDLRRIRQIFRDAFRSAVADDYQIVTDKGPDVLAVRASLVDLRTNAPLGSINAGRLSDVVRPGHMTFLMEMMDSRSGEVLVRAADEEKPDFETPLTQDTQDWAAVEAAAARWAGLFRSFLDRSLGGR